jgi:hypothetical protein
MNGAERSAGCLRSESGSFAERILCGVETPLRSGKCGREGGQAAARRSAALPTETKGTPIAD